mmetsp:Transcript_3911/g.15145  ORF Transcript_3911/g.15145 Transcript_3911/m.15145 type:complete len:215 (+) Transcript_3911:646-1290(+)
MPKIVPALRPESMLAEPSSGSKTTAKSPENAAFSSTWRHSCGTSSSSDATQATLPPAQMVALRMRLVTTSNFFWSSPCTFTMACPRDSSNMPSRSYPAELRTSSLMDLHALASACNVGRSASTLGAMKASISMKRAKLFTLCLARLARRGSDTRAPLSSATYCCCGKLSSDASVPDLRLHRALLGALTCGAVTKACASPPERPKITSARIVQRR